MDDTGWSCSRTWQQTFQLSRGLPHKDPILDRAAVCAADYERPRPDLNPDTHSPDFYAIPNWEEGNPDEDKISYTSSTYHELSTLILLLENLETFKIHSLRSYECASTKRLFVDSGLQITLLGALEYKESTYSIAD